MRTTTYPTARFVDEVATVDALPFAVHTLHAAWQEKRLAAAEDDIGLRCRDLGGDLVLVLPRVDAR